MRCSARTRQFPRVPTSATPRGTDAAREVAQPSRADADTACPNLPRPVTSRATPLPCQSRSNAVVVCGAMLSRAGSAFGARRASRVLDGRERRSVPVSTGVRPPHKIWHISVAESSGPHRSADAPIVTQPHIGRGVHGSRNGNQPMKAILALATLALVTLVLEEKGRQVAGEAKNAYGEAVVQARDATQSMRQSIGQQPLASLVIAGVVGYVLSLVVPHRP